jgi:hydrogenase nickel incorporation protein HypA/HybF
MHELALADAVVSAALSTARQERLDRISSVTVQVGELQQIRLETFEHLLRQVLPDTETSLAGTAFAVEIVPARFRCRPCGQVFGLAEAGEADAQTREAIHFIPELAHAFLRCPLCRSPDFEIVAGRGVSIDRIEGERDDD